MFTLCSELIETNIDTDSRQSRVVWTRPVDTAREHGCSKWRPCSRAVFTALEHGPWTGVVCTELKARPCGYRCSRRCVRSCRVETRQLHVWKTSWPMPTGDVPALKTSWPASERSRTVKTKNCSPRPCLLIKPWASVSHCWFFSAQWRNFFITLCQLFSRHNVGQALKNVRCYDITFFVR